MNYSYSSASDIENAPRQYAVLIYLPDRLERFVAPLRERFDPDYDLVSTHVTLVFPWKTAVPLAKLSAILASEVKHLSPVTLQLESVGDFYPEAPIIYWRIGPDETLHRLYRELYARFDLPLPFKELIPHVTVAKEISPHRVMLVKDQIASYLPNESFEMAAVDLVAPLADHHWASVRTFPVTGD